MNLMTCITSAASMLFSGTGDVTASAVYEVKVEIVEVSPVVRRKGAFVGGLEAADFLVYDQGQPVPIRSFSRAAVPLNITLVVDVSDSMDHDLSTVRDASLALIDQLEPADRISVIAFSDHITVATESSTDRQAAREALAELEADGGTSLYTTVMKVLERFRRGDQRNVLMLFSDGQDNRVALPFKVSDLALDKGIAIFTLYSPSAPFGSRGLQHLRIIADRTGGEARPLTTAARMGDLYRSILQDLRTQYQLAFSPAPGPDGKRKIEVKTVDSRYDVRCRKSYRYEQ